MRSMLFEPYCFIKFVEDNGAAVIEYIDNWTDGEVKCYFFDDDLVIDMQECIHIIVARQYLRKLGLENLNDFLEKLECPCPY